MLWALQIAPLDVGSMTPLEFVQQARWLAKSKGYKSSWVWVVFRQKYGKWPDDLLKEGEPQEASQEFIDWVVASWAAQRAEAQSS